MITEELETSWPSRDLKAGVDFSDFVEPLAGQDLYEVEKALADRSNLDRYVKRVLKVRRQPSGGSEKGK